MTNVTYNKLMSGYSLYLKLKNAKDKAKVQARIFRLNEIIKNGFGHFGIQHTNLDALDKSIVILQDQYDKLD